MGTEKKISVIIPVFNTEEYLERCLHSVCHNTFRNLEIICVNDGSTDGSPQILDAAAASDDRIQVIHKANGGLSDARNAGLRKATGEFIAFVDSDDWIDPRYFEALMYYQLQYHADIVVCREKWVREEVPFSDIPVDAIPVKKLKFDEAVLERTVKTYVWGRLYSKRILQGKYFEPRVKLGEDTIFNFDVMCDAEDLHMVLLEAEMYFYFQRESSLVHSRPAAEWMYVIEWFMAHMEAAPDARTTGACAEEAIKKIFAYRYLQTFSTDKKRIRRTSNQMIHKCLQSIKRMDSIPLKRKMQYHILAWFPVGYRAFRICKDRTMLIWEKEQKRKLKSQQVQ